MQIVVDNNIETHEIQDPFTETYLLHCLCCKGCIMILSWRICGSEPNNGWTYFLAQLWQKKHRIYIYIIYDCKPKNMVQFWNSPYCTPYSNTMTLGTSIFSSLLIFRFEKHVGTRLQHLQITHPKNPQGPSNGRVWTWIAGVRVLKIAIFEGSGFLGHWIVRGALSLSLPTRHVRWHHCSLCSNCFTMGRFHSWLLGGILAHANGDINHN